MKKFICLIFAAVLSFCLITTNSYAFSSKELRESRALSDQELTDTITIECKNGSVSYGKLKITAKVLYSPTDRDAAFLSVTGKDITIDNYNLVLTGNYNGYYGSYNISGGGMNWAVSLRLYPSNGNVTATVTAPNGTVTTYN